MNRRQLFRALAATVLAPVKLLQTEPKIAFQRWVEGSGPGGLGAWVSDETPAVTWSWWEYGPSKEKFHRVGEYIVDENEDET